MCQFSADFNDELARRNGYSDDIIIQSFTLDDVERFLHSLGVDEIDKQDEYLICPTICHNPIDQAETMKLYYYDKTKNFHCYTQCSENFSIITLYQRYMELNHQKITFDEAIDYLRRFVSLRNYNEEDTRPSNITYDFSVEEKQDIITLPRINPNVMDMFVPMSHPLWLNEGINETVQKQFNIRFSYQQNKIIIPHYDINGFLVGIRSRAIDEEDLAFGKYRPVQIGQEMYNHQLGFNLYGIWEHKEAIKRTKRAVIYEGESSPLSAFPLISGVQNGLTVNQTVKLRW